MELEENINQIIPSKEDRIMQNSFKNYFYEIISNIPEMFEKDSIPNKDSNIKRYLNNQDNEYRKLLELLPINIINTENFIEHYSNYINLLHKKSNKIPHFTNFEQDEIQVLLLLNFTNLASEKIDQYLDYDDKDNLTNNHLIKINNIIKLNPDLIGYIYILKWLQRIITLSYEDYNENEAIFKIINNRSPVNGEKNNDPIYLEKKCLSNNDEEYNNLMKQFIYCLFKGNLYECQLMCEQRQIEEFGNIFGGGCPLFDRIISTENDYNNFDKDLISPSMINKDYEEFSNLILNKNIDNDNNRNIYGNSLYLLWFKVMYENADYTKNNTLLNNIFRIISGNQKNYDLTNNNIYEYLYINILNLLHSKIFFELTQNPQHKIVQYHYIESETFKEISQVISNNGRNIFNILDGIIQNNNFSLLSKRYPFLWLELSFIKLFFLKIQIKENIKNGLLEDNNELYKKYFDDLNAIIIKMKKENDNYNKYFDDVINNEREFNYLSLSNKEIQIHEFYDMINTCLYRAYFSSLTTFFSIEKDYINLMKDNDRDNILEGKVENTFNLFDDIYCNYIKQIIKLNSENLDFNSIIYITTYMFNIKSIIFILTEISHYINSNEKYQEFIISLRKYYEAIIFNGESLSSFLIKTIINKSNLLKITDNQKNNFNDIDDALNYYVKLKMDNLSNYNNNSYLEEISDNDKYKISQILCLFEQTENKKLNQDTSYSYLLKLFIKFLVNFKYKEAYELKYQLKDYVYDQDSQNDELIIEKISEIKKEIDNINSLSDPDNIQLYTILINRYLFIIITDCFFFYANKIIYLYLKINNKNINLANNDKQELKKNVAEFIDKKIFNLNKLIKLIIGNEILYNYSMNYFGDETKNEYKKLLGDWAFQGIKWVYDIFKLGIIEKNQYDSLNCILEECIYNKEMMKLDYLMNGYKTNDILNSDNILLKKEKKLIEIMNDNQREKIIDFLYQMAKINEPYLNGSLDNELINSLNENKNYIIQELDFDFDD